MATLPMSWIEVLMIDLEDLKKKALAATPGPWTIGPFMTVEAGSDQICGVGETSSNLFSGDRRLNGEFIAAANPATVLELIERLERAGAGLARAQELCNKMLDAKNHWADRAAKAEKVLKVVTDRNRELSFAFSADEGRRILRDHELEDMSAEIARLRSVIAKSEEPQNDKLARRVLELANANAELLEALEAIAFATAPDPDDGSYHENAYFLATESIAKAKAQS